MNLFSKFIIEWVKGNNLLWDFQYAFLIVRAGKMLQLISGLVVIIEIIGIERIQQFGSKLHLILSAEKIKKPLKTKRILSIIEILKNRIKENEAIPEMLSREVYTGRTITKTIYIDELKKPMRDVSVPETVIENYPNPAYSVKENEYKQIRRLAAEKHLRSFQQKYQTALFFYNLPGILSATFYVLIMWKIHLPIENGSTDLLLRASYLVIPAILLFLCIRGATLAIRQGIKIITLGTFEFFILEPIAHVLSSKKLKTIALVASLIMFIIGAFIDFLYSE